MPDPRAVLFDLDDTIVDFSHSAERSWRETCEAAAERIGGFAAAELHTAIERSRDWYWADPVRHREGRADLIAASAHIVSLAFETLDLDPGAHTARELAVEYRRRRNEALVLVPGAVEAVQRLRARGVATGLVTNGSSTEQRAKIERFDLAPLFDHIQIEGEFGAGKPEQHVYHVALAGVHAAAHDTWFVGDHLEWDVGAPQRLGIFGVWVDYLGKGLPPDASTTPDRIVGSAAELA